MGAHVGALQKQARHMAPHDVAYELAQYDRKRVVTAKTDAHAPRGALYTAKHRWMPVKEAARPDFSFSDAELSSRMYMKYC